MMERPALPHGAAGMEPRVSFATVYLLTEVFVPLIVPLVIVAARRRPDGPVIACAATAIVCIAILWLLAGPQGYFLLFAGPQNGPFALRLALYAIGNVIGQAAWVLAVYQAALARRGRWIVALAAAQVVASAALLFSANPCIWAEATGGLGVNGCAPPAPLTLQVISAAWLLGPVAALAYALRNRVPRRANVPPGLAGSPLTALADGAGDADADADAELEVRAERL